MVYSEHNAFFGLKERLREFRPAVRPYSRPRVTPILIGLPVVLILLAAPPPATLCTMVADKLHLSWLSTWSAIILLKNLAAILSIWLVVARWERLQLTSVGLYGISMIDPLTGVGAFVISEYVWVLLSTGAGILSTPPNMSSAKTAAAALVSLPLWDRTAGSLVGAIAEELVCRGYLIERFTALTRFACFGAIVSLLVSVALHIPSWGLFGAFSVGPALLALVILYSWRRSLSACIIMHVLADWFPLVIWPLIQRSPAFLLTSCFVTVLSIRSGMRCMNRFLPSER